MKRVLIIANLYHASPRIPGVGTYLQEFGWEATIITPYIGKDEENRLGFPKQFLDMAKIVEANYRGDIFWFWRKLFKVFGFKTKESITEQIKKHVGVISKRSLIDFLMNWYQTFFAYPDTEKTWEKPALKAASEVLRKEHFDAILSSSPFPTSHVVAAELKKRFNLFWLADFRDLWTQNHNYPYNSLRRMIEKRLELRTLLQADALVTVSLPCAERLQVLHEEKPTYVITNGFDPEEINIPPIDLTSKFTITYTGQIYPGKQNPLSFFAALRNLISDGTIQPNDIEIRFYSPKQEWLSKEIERYRLSSITTHYGRVPKNVSLEKQRESQILLLLNWEDQRERGVYTTKIFEYLAAQRPILAVGGSGEDVVKKLLDETKSGVYCKNMDNVKDWLYHFYLEYKQKGEVRYKGDMEKSDKYSYREIAKKFADILNQISKE